MIEVFKTNIDNSRQADMLEQAIGRIFPDYRVNFDLEDCDNILRVVYPRGCSLSPLLEFIHRSGFKAEVLPEDVPVDHYNNKN